MASELEVIFSRTVKEQKAELNKAKKDLELEKILKALSLTDEEYEQFQQIKEEYRPTLYDVNLLLDDTIVGEYTARMSIFTAFILSKLNMYVSGPSASGKSALMDACINCVMPEDMVLLEGGSERVIVEQEHEIRKCKYLVAKEINKVNSELTLEVLKSFGEGKSFQYKRSSIRGGYDSFELEPRPFIFSRADESAASNPIGVELMSRLTEVTVDSSQDQTIAVLTRQAENFVNPFEVNHVDLVNRACLRWHTSNLPEFDVCVSPAAQLLKDYIPTVFTSARRKFVQYKANADGIARFYYKERVTGEIQGKTVIFVTPEDYFYNHLIFGQNLIDAALQCSNLQKTIMKIIMDNGNLSKQDIQQKLRSYSINQSIKTLESHLAHLSDLGYLTISKEGRENFYSASSFYKYFNLRPNMKEVIERCRQVMQEIDLYTPYAEEYIARFCDPDNACAVNPFNGKRVDMLHFEFKSVFDLDTGTTRMQDRTPEEEPVKKGFTCLNDF